MQLIREAAARGALGEGSVVYANISGGVIRSGYPNSYRQVILQCLKVDPRMAPWRRDPEILAILSPAAQAAGRP